MAKPLELTVAERVRAVYQEVWHEFFDWEREYCLQTLASLVPATNATSITPEEPLENKDPTILSLGEPTYIDVDCTKLTYSTPDGEGSSEVLSCPTYACDTLPPAQPYEACTYTHKNLYIADDHCEKLSFIPFADDPRFPTEELIGCYDSTGWEIPRKDPDYDMIAAEAARRLHFRFGIPFAKIDETGILPTVIIEQPDKKGLLHILNQRDLLPWIGSINSDLPPLPQTDAPLPTALETRVNGIRYLFCANLNCVEPYCPTHLNLDEQLKKPTNFSVDGDVKGKRDPPCGYDCYKYNSEELEGLTAWDAATEDDFKFILEGAADLSSCDLAVVCDKPCREVYAHRRIHSASRPDDENDSSQREASDSDADSLLEDKPIFDDVVRGSKASVALPPITDALADAGPKYASIWESATHKQTAGVIARTYIVIVTVVATCLVVADQRDVDARATPKISVVERSSVLVTGLVGSATQSFVKSVAQNVKQNGGCRNNGLQHGVAKMMEVKTGAYGLGLFLIEVAHEGDLIGEYVGEILSDKMADARGVLTRHLGRNYLFGLNEQWTIDAALAGNEMRFINHATGSQANCRAEVREVNGDHRIGIYVVKKVIQPGQELFMDYGKEYFTSRHVSGTPRAESKR